MIKRKLDDVLSYILGCMENQIDYSYETLDLKLQGILELYDPINKIHFNTFRVKLEHIVEDLNLPEVSAMVLFENIEDGLENMTQKTLYVENMSSIHFVLSKHLRQLRNYLRGYCILPIEKTTMSEKQTEPIDDDIAKKGATLFEKYLYLYLSYKHQKNKEADSLIDSRRHESYIAHLFDVTPGTVQRMREKINNILNEKSEGNANSQRIKQADKILRQMRKDNKDRDEDWIEPMINEMEEIKEFLVQTKSRG